MQRFARVALNGKVGREAIGHLAVSFGSGERVVLQQRCGSFAPARLHVAEGQGGHGNAQRCVVVNDALKNLDGGDEIPFAHLLIAGRCTQQRMARFEGQAFLQVRLRQARSDFHSGTRVRGGCRG